MDTKGFSAWLEALPLQPKPVYDCISRCRRVERSLGIDLDEEYEHDRGKSVLVALTYTIHDERDNKPAPKSFSLTPGANIRYTFSDLRTSVNKYISFRDLEKKKKRKKQTQHFGE